MPVKIFRDMSHSAFVADPKASIVVGDMRNVSAAYVKSQPSDPFTHATRSGMGRIVIANTPVLVDDGDAIEWNYPIKAQLADLVDKGMIVVEMPVGTPLTSAAIRAL